MREWQNCAMAEHKNRDLITAYWREVLPHCQTKRTAQHHAKTQNPKWVQWLATQGRKVHDTRAAPTAVSVKALALRLENNPPPPAEGEMPAGPLPAPPAITKAAELRTPEEHAECEAWEMFTRNTAAAKRMADSDSITAAGFARIACQCLASYHVARSKRVQSDIENQRLLPVTEYEALCNDARKMADLWKSLVPDLAAQIDPANPARINRLFDAWIQERINPVVQRFILTGEMPLAA
jgi:hypothetical protein